MTVIDKDIDPKPDPRTEETRRNLIEVGIRLFGRHGYDAVSTRTITKDAGANLSAITYHFGGKEGFYHACLVHILDQMSEFLAPLHAHLDTQIDQIEDDRQALSNLVAQFAFEMIQDLLLNENFESERAFILREHATPSRFYGEFIDRVPNLVLAVAEKIVMKTTGMAPGHPETRIRSFAFFGQILSLMVARQALKHQLEIDHYDQDTVAMITRQVSLSMTASLHLPPPENMADTRINHLALDQGQTHD